MKKTDTFSFGPWKITTAKGAILKAGDVDRISAELELPSLPEMVFGDNILQIDHSAGFGIQFNAIDALKHVDNKHDLMKVAVAEEWQSKRQDSEYIKEVIKPFDWTFTTDYRGTLTGKNKMTMKVESTDERIDMEQLKVKEKIYFYEDVILFEDELADNGISKLNVKMRVMQGGFFLLLRFFMRVDGVLIRINDTRIYHKAGSSYMLREYSSKERKMEEILGLKVPITDPTELAQHLVLKNEIFERLSFPDGVDEKFGVEQSFVNTVEEMEKAFLVPQSLQDMSLSSSNGVVLEKSLFESFTVLRNIKNIVLTGHALDDENGNTPHTPFSDELLALTQTLQKLTGLANNLTAEYKEKFNLLF